LDRSNFVLIGKITKVRGLKGQMKVYPLTDFPEQFAELDGVYVDSGDSWKAYQISKASFSGNQIFLNFKGVDTPEEAGALVGSEIYMEDELRMELPQDNFYFDEIEGFKVISAAGEEIGVLVDVYHFPASDTLAVDRKGREVLIPFVKALVPEIDFESGIIKIIDLPTLWSD